MLTTTAALLGIAMTSSVLPKLTQLQGLHEENGKWRFNQESVSAHFNPTPEMLDPDKPYILLEIESDKPITASLFYLRTNALPVNARNFAFNAAAGTKSVHVIDLSVLGKLRSDDNLHLNMSSQTGAVVRLSRMESVTLNDVPADSLAGLIDFRPVTSKLHYRQDEKINYRCQFQARNYPERQSSKLINVKLKDAEGKVVDRQFFQAGIQPVTGVKEVFGSFPAQRKAGKYTLEAEMTDQKTGFKLSASHDFGVTDKKSPALFENPFKFVKDFSLIKGQDGLWHLFSITGDFVGTHEWYEDGQERTFSHATSKDLRRWTIHPPVLSITDAKHPDGNGFVKNRNIWAPHVIRHDGKYWMFYTSVNDYTCQSVSLATSDDLFNWTDYEKNPVLTMENVPWAAWERNVGSACRDPNIVRDGDRFLMYVTADANSGEERGVVAVAESTDLLNWRNPVIAVRGRIACESPQVWKSGNRWYMFTSSYGGGTFSSDDPVTGWVKDSFPRAPLPAIETYVMTSGGYAEEVVDGNGGKILAVLTWRTWGNSIYFFKIITDDTGRPIRYEDID